MAKRRLNPPQLPHPNRHRRLRDSLPGLARPPPTQNSTSNPSPTPDQTLAQLLRPRPPETSHRTPSPDEGRQALYALIELAKPGTAWVQFTEGSLEHLTPEQGQKYPVLARFQTLVAGMSPHFRWDPRPRKLVRQWLEEYGLVVQEKVMEIPIEAGNADKKLAKMAKLNMLEVVANFRAAAMRLPDGTGIRAEDFDPILRDIKVEFETVGGILRFNTVWGGRP